MYKNYNMKQITLSLDLEIYLEENDIAFAIDELVESIPEEIFSVFDHKMGTTSYHPKMMLKLLLCGYTQSIFSGRKIEAMSKDSIRAMWLTQSQFPNFRTINRFRVNPLVQPILQECFIQFRNQLVSQKLIDEEAIFIDGTKLEANANKYTFVWKKSTERFEESLRQKSKESYFDLPTYIVADAGYGSEENYQAILDEFERTPLITYTMYQKEQTKKYKKDPFITDNWTYNELADTYTCPNNREMKFRNYSTRTDKYGFKKQLKIYECESCFDCPVRNLCTRSKSNKNRVIQKNGNWEYFKAHVRELLKEEFTGEIYRQRKIDVEPAFGNLKANLAFNRFSVRGKDKITQELGFALMALNLRKWRKNKKEIRQKTRKNKYSKMSYLIFEYLFSLKETFGSASFNYCQLIILLDSFLIY